MDNIWDDLIFYNGACGSSTRSEIGSIDTTAVVTDTTAEVTSMILSSDGDYVFSVDLESDIFPTKCSEITYRLDTDTPPLTFTLKENDADNCVFKQVSANVYETNCVNLEMTVTSSEVANDYCLKYPSGLCSTRGEMAGDLNSISVSASSFNGSNTVSVIDFAGNTGTIAYPTVNSYLPDITFKNPNLHKESSNVINISHYGVEIILEHDSSIPLKVNMDFYASPNSNCSDGQKLDASAYSYDNIEASVIPSYTLDLYDAFDKISKLPQAYDLTPGSVFIFGKENGVTDCSNPTNFLEIKYDGRPLITKTSDKISIDNGSGAEISQGSCREVITCDSLTKTGMASAAVFKDVNGVQKKVAAFRPKLH